MNDDVNKDDIYQYFSNNRRWFDYSSQSLRSKASEYADRLLKDYSKAKNIFNGYDENDLLHAIESERLGKPVKSIKLSMDSAQVGCLMPLANINEHSDNTIGLSVLKNKAILIYFWSADCAPCQATMPKILEWKQFYLEKKQPFEVLALNVDKEREKMDEFLLNNDLPFIHAYLGQGNRLLHNWNITGFPTKILLDKQGKVITRNPSKALIDILFKPSEIGK